MTLRPMTMNDGALLREIKNYPETRHFAIASHNKIKLKDHYEWLQSNVQYFQTILIDYLIVGFIRIKDNEISIWIERERWGEGIATEAICNVAYKGMMAKIVNGNIGSFRAFIKAGFVPISYYDNYYTLQKQ